MIRKLITEFPDHLETALAIGRSANLKATDRKISNVLITGLGGSGIGGKIASLLVAGEATAPIFTNNTYFIPKWVGPETLVIASSFSGNTEETLAAANAALDAGAQLVCLTSGGEIKAIADARELNQINVPGGMPPRQAFGFTFPQLFFLLRHHGIISGAFEAQLEAAVTNLRAGQQDMIAEAQALADKLRGTMPFIYTVPGFEGVAVRFRQQLNENSKMLACHHVYPEMCHNELVGWSKQYPDTSIVLFRNESDYSRNQVRMKITLELMKECTSNINEVWAKGDSDLERSLYLIHLGDWVTLLLAELDNIDPFAIDSIIHLKDELAKV